MGTFAETEISRFWQELPKQLRDLPALCIVGYDFHAGYGLPHFRDTIMGVWSTADVPNNPFLHPDQASVVLRWADARRNIALRCAQFRNIPAYDQKKSVSQLAYLQQMLGFKVADQSPDGFLAASQLAEVIELYGCVTRGRCIHLHRSKGIAGATWRLLVQRWDGAAPQSHLSFDKAATIVFLFLCYSCRVL